MYFLIYAYNICFFLSLIFLRLLRKMVYLCLLYSNKVCEIVSTHLFTHLQNYKLLTCLKDLKDGLK